METSSNRLKYGIILTIAAWTLMGILSALVKDASQLASPALILFYQYLISLAVTLPFIPFKRDFFISSHKLLIFLRSLFGLGEFFFYFSAVAFVPLIDATLLLNTAPFFIPLILYLWKQQKVESKFWWPMIVGFIGIICVLKPGTQILQWGALLALLAGVMQAGIMVSLRLMSSEPTLRVIFYYLLWGTCVLSPMIFVHEAALPTFIYVEMVGIGIIFALVQYLFTKSFEYGSPVQLGPFSYIFIIVSTLLDWWIWGHVPDLLTWVGFSLIFLGLSLIIALSKRSFSIDEY